MGSNNVLRMTEPANLTFERLILGLNLLESVLTQSVNERGLVENTLLSRKMGARFLHLTCSPDQVASCMVSQKNYLYGSPMSWKLSVRLLCGSKPVQNQPDHRHVNEALDGLTQPLEVPAQPARFV